MKRKLSIGIVSNCVYEPYLSKALVSYCGKENMECLIHYYNSDDLSELLANLGEIDLLVYWENISEKLSGIITAMMKSGGHDEKVINEMICSTLKKIECIKKNYNGEIIVFNYENYNEKMRHVWGNIISRYNLVEDINYKIKTFITDTPIIDIRTVIAEVGIKNAYDPKGERRWGNPYSRVMVEQSAREIIRCYKKIHGKNKKCIVLDCDNVLWGGEVSERGVNDIYLGKEGRGKSFYAFQQFILKLYYSGMILAINSKNEKTMVKDVFDNNSDMLINLDMISSFKVNWKDKSHNMLEIAEELNLSLDSFIFIDDSEYEISVMKKNLPMVHSILFNENDIYENMEFLNLSDDFDRDMIRIRNKTYQDNMKRRLLLEHGESQEAYLSKLKTDICIEEANMSDYSRISELSFRTNKCTLGSRYDIYELKKIPKLYSIRVKDCFGDLGLVGAIGISGINQNELVLFCLSCRAFGRLVEEFMIDYIKKQFKIDYIVYKDTTKNSSICEAIKSRLLK